MKLRINAKLRAAVIAAITAVGFTLSQAQATAYNGVEYSGNIFTIENTGNHTYHDATFSNWYHNGEEWTSSTTWIGTATSYYEGETQRPLSGGNNFFWRRMFGDANGGDASLLGNTLRLHNASGTTYYEAQFSPFRLGGVIAEAGDATYIVGRKSGECGITLQARTGASANMSIGADTILSVGVSSKNNGHTFTVATGGTWNVASGKTLSIGQHNGTTLGNASVINFNSGVNVTMNGGGTIDLTHTNALKIGEGATISVGADTKLLLASNTTLGGTITNNGTVTFAGGTVTLTNSLSGFERSGKYVNWQDQEAENGYVEAMDYTIIKGTSSLTQVIWKDETKDLTNGVLHVEGEVDKTTYHMTKSGATLDLAEEIGHNSALTTVEVEGETGTITVNSNSTLGSLSIASGSTATVNGTANLTLNGLTGTGALVKDGNAKLTLGAQLNATNTTSITVNAGELAITQKTAGDTFHNITVAQGATVSVAGAGNSDYRLRYTLDGGTLAYTGSTTGGSVQNDQITLTKDSYISGTGNFYMLAGNFGVTNLILDNHKLIKQGNNTVTLYNTHVGEGTIEVQGGMIDFSSAHNDPEVSADIILNGGAIAGTLNMMKNLSLTAAVDTTLSSGVTVKGSGKTLSVSVGEMKTLTFGGGLTVSSGTVKVNGDVTISGKSLDLSGNNASTGKVEVSGDSILNVKDGMWMGSNAGIDIAKDGTLNIANLNIVGGETTASVIATKSNQQYGVTNADITIKNATVTAMGNVTIGNTLVNSDVVTGAHEVTLNSSANSVIVSDGGTFTKGASATVGTITVEEEGTIAGGVDVTDVTLKVGAIATFNEESSIGSVEDNVFIYNVDQAPLKIENVGEQAAKYEDLHQAGMKVYADTLYSRANSVTVANTVAVEAIQHLGEGSLTLAHVDADPLSAIEVTDGSLILQDVAAATISSMEIAAGSSVAVYTDGTQGTEGTVTITETLAAGSATLLANLTIEDTNLQDTVLPLLDVNGGGANALTLGSQFGIVEGTIVSLDAVTMAAIEGMKEGENLDLIKAGQVQLSYLNPGYDGMDYGQLFQRTEGMLGNYVVYANGDAFGVTKQGAVPEPTTGTLSLLALMALAARRRRK